MKIFCCTGMVNFRANSISPLVPYSADNLISRVAQVSVCYHTSYKATVLIGLIRPSQVIPDLVHGYCSLVVVRISYWYPSVPRAQLIGASSESAELFFTLTIVAVCQARQL